jgi:glucose-6-phosphate 1-dehydrogenase
MTTMAGDQTLFVRADEVEWAWRLYAPDPPPSRVRPYPAGAWGPAEAAALMKWPDPTLLYR